MDLQFEIIEINKAKQYEIVQLNYSPRFTSRQHLCHAVFRLVYHFTKPNGSSKNKLLQWKKMMYVLNTRPKLNTYIDLLDFLTNNRLVEGYSINTWKLNLSFEKLSEIFEKREVIFGVDTKLFHKMDIFDFMKYCDKTYLEMINRKLLENK